MPSVLNTATVTASGFNQVVGAVRDVYSAELWFSALPILKFDQFTTKKTELGAQRGDTIVMTKINDIAPGGPLAENVRLKAQAMSSATQRITISEQGNAVTFSERLLNTSFYDQMSTGSFALGRDMAKVLDMQLRDSYRQGAINTIYPNGKTARNQLTAGVDLFNTQDVKDAVELLETNSSPKFGADYYICFCTPHQARGLRDDPDWQNVQYYGGSGYALTGEVGRYEDVRFVSTAVMPQGQNSATDPITGAYKNLGYDPSLAGAGASGANIHQAIFFGEFSIGHATALPVELRTSGVVDYGREHGLAWYGIWGQGVLDTNNIVVCETT